MSSYPFRRGFVRMPRTEVIDHETTTSEMREQAPAKLDWTTLGATTPVKNQGHCGSCWAYSTTETIESALFMKTGKLEELAEQQVISCDRFDNGCNGGDIPSALKYVQQEGGITLESHYPDTSAKSGRTGKCKKSDISNSVKVTSWRFAIPECTAENCTQQPESDLMAQLHKHGPLGICVNAESWSDYNGGIMTGPCPGGWSDLDHCVQLVGYDNTHSTPYWKVRNSWTSNWGENGYIRLAMGGNVCGVASEAVAIHADFV